MASVEYYAGPRCTPIQGQEGATQTFHPGDLVKLDTSGYVVIATSGAITGIACQHATGTTAATIEWEPICFDAIYSAHYKASATAQTLVGDCLDFTTLTVGAHSLDESGATTDVYCVGLDSRDPVATSGGRLLVKFYPALGVATGT
jgi:hypothetical protein